MRADDLARFGSVLGALKALFLSLGAFVHGDLNLRVLGAEQQSVRAVVSGLMRCLRAHWQRAAQRSSMACKRSGSWRACRRKDSSSTTVSSSATSMFCSSPTIFGKAVLTPAEVVKRCCKRRNFS